MQVELWGHETPQWTCILAMSRYCTCESIQTFQKGLFNLRMGLEILKDEPEDTFERKIVEGSKDSVEQLEGWVKTVCESI